MFSRVCVGPSHGGQSNISWDPLPCHLQNGADIIGNNYIIQYTHLAVGEPTNISSSRSDNKLECHQDSSGHYTCLTYASLFAFGETYSFQVAARNIYGVGSFSNPVIAVYGSQGSSCFCTWHDNNNNCYGFCSGHKINMQVLIVHCQFLTLIKVRTLIDIRFSIILLVATLFLQKNLLL